MFCYNYVKCIYIYEESTVKTTVAIFIFFIIAVAVFPFLHLDGEKETKSAVVTSNFALYDITRALLKEDVKVRMLLPVGADLHTFEPTPRDVMQIKQSDFFIYSGANIEHYLENFTDKNSVDMSQYITLLSHTNGKYHHSSAQDPHYWLDIDNMITMSKHLEKIYSSKYIELVPKIEERTTNYIQSLQMLKETYAKALLTCKLDEIVVNHNAYAYLADNYNFHVHSLSGLSSDAQVNAKNMITLTKEIKKENITTIFYDSFETANEMQSLAIEANISISTLNTLANITQRQYDRDATYVMLMQENLEKLSKAMDCQ